MRACRYLGNCHAAAGKLVQALAYLNQSYQISRELQLRGDEIRSALFLGSALGLAVSADCRGHATEASLGQASPHTPSSLSEGMKDRVEEARKWLQIALEGGVQDAHLQLAHVAFDTGQEEEALGHLMRYLAWCVEKGRNACRGCEQVRGEDAQMLTCGGKLCDCKLSCWLLHKRGPALVCDCR